MNKKFQLAIHMIPTPEQDREEQEDADLTEEDSEETYSNDRSDALTVQPAE